MEDLFSYGGFMLGTSAAYLAAHHLGVAEHWQRLLIAVPAGLGFGYLLWRLYVRSPRAATPVTVAFACVHNAGRSQMAAAFFNELADPAVARALSAGTEPAERVHPEVLKVMQEVGIDLSDVTPRKLTPELAAGAKFLVTMGCDEACPVVPGAVREDWRLADPGGQSPEAVRAIRDEVQRRVRELVAREGWE
jgi:arsenate reductase